MEKAFYQALAEIAIQNTVDEWGNPKTSPLLIAVNKWADENTEKISAIVVKNLGLNELAEEVAKRITQSLESSNWSEKHKAENLRNRVDEILAEKLADIELKKIQDKK